MRRTRLRLRRFDYAADGWYFVTFTTRDRLRLLGDIVVSYPSAVGRIVRSQIERLETRVDVCVVMPDHVHAGARPGEPGANAVGARYGSPYPLAAAVFQTDPVSREPS
jgi:hypothetical protein